MTTLYVMQLEEFMLEPLARSLGRDASVGPVYLHRRPPDEVWARARSRLGERVQLRPVDDITHHRAVLQAEAACLPVTEALWQEIPAAGRLGRMLNRFFSDPHGEYVLKKSLASNVESRLESVFTADILARAHAEPVLLVPTSPLDEPIVEAVKRFGTPPELAIQVWRGQPYRSAFERRFARAGIRAALRTLLWLLRMPLRRGLQWRVPVSRPYFKVACDNKWTKGQHFGGRDDLFLVDNERIRREDVLILCNGVQPDRVVHYRAVGVTAVSGEPAAVEEPRDRFLHRVVDLAHREGALVILDEMITGFRWHLKGAQHLYGVRPDLTTFGKAIGNGFSVSVLAGRREVMELGGSTTTSPGSSS